MDAKLLEILVCPLCKSPLIYRKAEQELICKADKLAYAIKDDIPVMLADEARKLSPEEIAKALAHHKRHHSGDQPQKAAAHAAGSKKGKSGK